MKIKLHRLARSAYIVLALAFGAITLVPALGGTVFAGQVTSRSIELSNSTAGATGVTYSVSFKPTASTTVGGIVVDFCADSPIIGNSSCTFPTGFTLGTSPSVTVTSGIGTGGTWVTTNSLQCGAAASNYQVLKFTNSTAQSVTAGTPVVFTINSVANPSTTGSFYARIVTFDTDTDATGNYTCPTGTTRGGSLTGELDYGGIALSTTTAISITAKVQETLTFCVSAADLTSSSCASATAPTLNLGHSVGGVTVLDSGQVDNVHAYTQTSTNAQSGIVVRMKNTNASATCGGLSNDSGTTCGIPAAGASAITISAGTAHVGMCVTPGSANTTAASPYNSASCTQFGLDESTSQNNVLSTYGSQIFSSTGAISQENDDLNFEGTAALTTKAGVYTANYALIATGTF